MHCQQLLNQLLGCVRHRHLNHVLVCLAATAVIKLTIRTPINHHAAPTTNEHVVGIRNPHHTLLQNVTKTMTQNTISFHLPETQTPSLRSTMGGLASQGHHLAPHSAINFVLNHVPESLIVDRSDEDRGLEYLS